MKTKASHKRAIGLIIAAAFIIVFAVLPGSESGLTHAGFSAIGLFCAAIILWMLDVFPMAISAAIIVVLFPLFGIMTFKEAVAGFSTSSVIFIFGTFAITAAMKASSIPLRITALAIKFSKGNAKRLILAFCLAAGLISSFMSSTAVCVMFWMFANTILKVMQVKRGESNLGRALAITVPVAAGVGGFMTPAGTPGNILMIDFMAQYGYEISFSQWTLIAFPIGLLTLIVFALWIGRVFEPEGVSQMAQDSITDKVREAGSWDARDYKTLAIIAAMIVMWFMGSWVPYLNTATVAVIGMTVMFLPGIDILDWNKMKEDANTNILLMMGLAPIISSALSSTGALDYIVGRIFGGGMFSNMNGFILLVVVIALVCILRAFIPTPAAVVSLLGPLMYTIAQLTGANPVVLFLSVSFWGAAAMLLLYTEPIFFFSFAEGYFTEKDLLKSGWLPCAVMSIAAAVLIPLLAAVAGF